MKTAERLATEYKVDEKTIRRDGQYAAAIDTLAENVGEEIKQKILTRDTTVTRKEVLSLAKMEPEQQKAVAEKIASGEAKSVKQAKVQEQAEKIKQEPSPLPTGPFRVIVVDPPWSYDNRAEDPKHRAANPYPSMTIEEIEKLPVGKIAADDSILWLWTTNAFMHEAYHLAATWGFEIKTILTWVKDRMGTGDWLRGQTEHCLMAVKGKPTVTLTNQTTVINGLLREHSRKPEEFYTPNTAERLAAEYKVGVATVKRAGQFVEAADTIGENVGEEVKQKILAGDSALTKEAVIVIAREEAEKQREIFASGEAEILRKAKEIKREWG